MILTEKEIKTWQQRLEETCPALGPMHIHACVEEVNDAMQAEINDLRVALQEQAREGEAVAWHHGCNVLCANIDLWIDRCPHCGKPRPAAPAPQPAQPSEPAQPEQSEQRLDMVAQPEQGERAAQKAELLKNLTQWLDGLGLEIHTYSLRGIALHGFEKGWDAALQSAQPVALPMADVAKNATLEAELATLHANGAKAWAGVDPQELRTGMTPLSQPDKQRLWNDARHNNPQAIEDAAMEYGTLVEAAHGIGGAL